MPLPPFKSIIPWCISSRDDIGEWLKHQEVNQFFQHQQEPRVVSSMIPRRPFHSLSLDLIDKSNKPSYNKGLSYRFILVIIDNFSRYLFCYPLVSKSPSTTSITLEKLFNDLEREFPNHELLPFMHMDKRTIILYKFQRNIK